MYFDEILKAYHIENEETVIKIPFENIQKISKGYLFYKNCDGVTENINLDDCVRNFNISIGKEMRNQSGKIIRNKQRVLVHKSTDSCAMLSKKW